MTTPIEHLLETIATRTVHVGIIGMGYVGLPLTLAFIERARVRVTGFDIDADKVRSLTNGESYIMHLGAHRIADARASALFDATSDFDRLTEPDVLIIAVPTPLTPHRQPDMRYVVRTAQAIQQRLRAGQLVVLESTTYPGTTEELLKDILEESGLKCGTDFLLAFSPEREDPGNRQFSTTSIPKIVGGFDSIASEAVAAVYKLAFDQVVVVSSPRTAEATKLTENIFRAVNIALVNELKMVFDRMGIDIWEVLDAADTKPFGFMKFLPGPGLGGHCIPLDPFFLAWKARQYGVSTRFVELAGEVNVSMPNFVIGKLQAALNERSKAVNGSRVLVLGLAYKRNIDDPRESPSFELIHQLLGLGATVLYHDPHISIAPKMRSWPELPEMRSVPLELELVKAMDAVLIATDHADVDYEMIATHAQLVVDTRGIYRDYRKNIVKA